MLWFQRSILQNRREGFKTGAFRRGLRGCFGFVTTLLIALTGLPEAGEEQVLCKLGVRKSLQNPDETV